MRAFLTLGLLLLSASPAFAAKDEFADCVACHDDAAAKHPFHPFMAADAVAVPCATCHAGKHPARAAAPASCVSCHDAEVKEFAASAHGRAAAKGEKEAPTCLTCHRGPVASGKDGETKAALKHDRAKLCESCHLDKPEIRARVNPSAGFIASYETSVHGAAVARGNGEAATCVDCHGAHAIRDGDHGKGGLGRDHVRETCAKCHGAIASTYAKSVHGTALARGVADAPACTTCHGEHTILKHTDPRSPVAAANVSQKVCSPCHASVRLSEKYGIASDRFQTFEASYHGLAIKGGSVGVANCASCHGAHDILPSADPASRVSKANLAATCGRCHPGANARFAAGTVHVTEGKKGEPILYAVSTIYIWMIVVTIGGMLLHNALDFFRKARHKIAVRRGEVEEAPAVPRRHLRMTRLERLQHASLLVSFFLLAFTGFMLRFPDAWWVEAIRRFSHRAFELRSLVHRIAAVVMCAASVFHLAYVFATARGRQLIKDFLPRLTDLREFEQSVKHLAGLSHERPRFGRFGYVEKAEYWALVWGTIVMAATGFVMWFDNTFLGILGKLGYDVARTIHYYEAWLATLAILVWHLYFVMLNPEVYPMNLAWVDGTLSEKEMRDEHPRELDEIHAREAEAPEA